MALNHTHTVYPNFVLENRIEDQFKSHLNLLRFCTVNNDLVGVAGDTADAVALLNLEQIEGIETFAFVNPKDMAKVRKALADELKYVEAFARTGYVGTVAGVNLYTKKDAVENTICGGTREAVTLFNKTGTEVEQKRDPNTRLNEIFSRKYYLAAMTDQTKAFKITLGVAGA